MNNLKDVLIKVAEDLNYSLLELKVAHNMLLKEVIDKMSTDSATGYLERHLRHNPNTGSLDTNPLLHKVKPVSKLKAVSKNLTKIKILDAIKDNLVELEVSELHYLDSIINSRIGFTEYSSFLEAYFDKHKHLLEDYLKLQALNKERRNIYLELKEDGTWTKALDLWKFMCI